jgi:hypothetical protein
VPLVAGGGTSARGARARVGGRETAPERAGDQERDGGAAHVFCW